MIHLYIRSSFFGHYTKNQTGEDGRLYFDLKCFFNVVFFFLILQNFYEYHDFKNPQISTDLCCNNFHVLIE